MRTFAWTWLLLPGISGILVFASFPSLNQGYLAWISLVPLLLYLSRSSRAAHAFLGGWIAGAITSTGLLVWIPPVLENYGGVTGPTAWLLYALLITMEASYPAAVCWLTGYAIIRGGPCYLLIFPFAWITAEIGRTHLVFGGFPWLLLGYSQTGVLPLMQIADLVGVYGVSFLVALFNVAIAWWLLRAWHQRSSLWLLGTVATLLVASGVYGWLQIDGRSTEEPAHRVALLQGNLSFDDPYEVLVRKFGDGYLDMASRLEDPVDLLILPESPSPRTFEEHGEYRQQMQALARRSRFGLVFNNVYEDRSTAPPRYYNSAYYLDGNGHDGGRYDKIHLVPFGEYLPLESLFSFAETVTRDVGNFAAGSEYRLFHLLEHPVSSLICFEAVFPDLARRFVRRGSRLLINLTNDAWYGDSSAPSQHLTMARWRAVENRRYLLRAANTGITAVIAPTGIVAVSTGLFREESCVGRFDFETEQTFYTRHGDAFAYLCAIITGLTLLRFGVRRGRFNAEGDRGETPFVSGG